MGWNTRRGAGPDERRNQLAQNRQYQRDSKKLKQGDPKAERINDLHNERTAKARREGR